MLFWFPTQSCCLLLGYLCSSSSCPWGSLLQRAPSQCGKSVHSSWVNFRFPFEIRIFDKKQLHVPFMSLTLYFFLFLGIGWAMCLISAMVSIYYNVIIMYSIYYMFVSFVSIDTTLPWQTCFNSWNTDKCTTKPYPKLSELDEGNKTFELLSITNFRLNILLNVQNYKYTECLYSTSQRITCIFPLQNWTIKAVWRKPWAKWTAYLEPAWPTIRNSIRQCFSLTSQKNVKLNSEQLAKNSGRKLQTLANNKKKWTMLIPELCIHIALNWHGYKHVFRLFLLVFTGDRCFSYRKHPMGCMT